MYVTKYYCKEYNTAALNKCQQKYCTRERERERDHTVFCNVMLMYIKTCTYRLKKSITYNKKF